jgi:4-hydroxy-tetrahydrodipicolinate synthase
MPHTGCLSLRDTIALTQHAQKIGATFVVVGNPPVSTHDPEELYHFFRGLCAEVDIAVSLFNTPICGYSLSPQLVAHIAELPNIFAIKNPLPVEHTDQVRRLAGDKIIVCDPSESRWLDNIVKHKDQVYMSSPDPYLLQVPGRLLIREYTHKAMAGDVAGAREVSSKLDAVRRISDRWMNSKWQEPSVPINAIKYWSELLGFTGGNPREPMRPLSAGQKRELKQELQGVGLV